MDTTLNNTIFIPLYTILFALAFASLIYPERAVQLKGQQPFFYKVLLALASVIQLPILVSGYWETGILFSKIDQVKIFDTSIYFLPILYLGIFLLSLYSQKRKKYKLEGGTSFTLAVFISIILVPCVYLSLMSILYNQFK